MYAYVDDVYIVGEVDDVLAAYAAFIEHLRDIELTVNAAKCSLLYFHDSTHLLTDEQLTLLQTAGLHRAADDCLSADVLGAIIGCGTAAIARRLECKLGGAGGLFGAFFRRVQSGGFSVQTAMLLLSNSVGRMSYLLRCLPPDAIRQVALHWDSMVLGTATRVLDLSTTDAANIDLLLTMQLPRRLGGFGLPAAYIVSPFAFLASVAASAAHPGDHPLSCNALPTTSLLYECLHATLTSNAVVNVSDAVDALHCIADTFTGYYHNRPAQAAHLQSRLTAAANNSTYNARVSEVTESGDLRGLVRLHSVRAPYASRWKSVRPTEAANELPDEYYRYAARRDLGLPPTSDTVLPRQCGACGMRVAADGFHGQRCIYNSTYTKLRHDTIEKLLHDTVRDGVGHAYRQQHNLPGADRTIPDLVIVLDGKQYLCDITVADPLPDTNLATAAQGPGRVARAAVRGKVAKYSRAAEQMKAVHLPFAVEATGVLSETAQQLLREIHHSAGQHCTWPDADSIGTHLVDSIATAVQRCAGMALRASLVQEARVVMGAA